MFILTNNLTEQYRAFARDMKRISKEEKEKERARREAESEAREEGFTGGAEQEGYRGEEEAGEDRFGANAPYFTPPDLGVSATTIYLVYSFVAINLPFKNVQSDKPFRSSPQKYPS